MNEILPGIYHWTRVHPKIKIEVSSYYLAAEHVLIDPLEPEQGLDWFRGQPAPEHILLSNRHHYRDSGKFAAAFGCTVHASRPGMHEFAEDQPVEPFDFGDELPGGVKAYEVGVVCPDETALHLPSHAVLSVADGLVNYGGLGFVPDEYLGDDPEGVRRGLKQAYSRLLELDFDSLLFAHGAPLAGGAKDALAEFAGGD